MHKQIENTNVEHAFFIILGYVKHVWSLGYVGAIGRMYTKAHAEYGGFLKWENIQEVQRACLKIRLLSVV